MQIVISLWATRVVKILNSTSWHIATVLSSRPHQNPWMSSPRSCTPKPLHDTAAQGIILGLTGALCLVLQAVPVLLVTA